MDWIKVFTIIGVLGGVLAFFRWAIMAEFKAIRAEFKTIMTEFKAIRAEFKGGHDLIIKEQKHNKELFTNHVTETKGDIKELKSDVKEILKDK